MTERSTPATRARYMKTFVDAVDALGPQRAGDIRGRVGPDLIGAIDRAGALSWIPLACNTAFTFAVVDVLGDAHAERFFQRLMLDSLETPLFDGFIKATVRVLGLDPGALVRVVGRIFGVMFRASGDWRVVDRTANGAVLRVEGLATACRTQTWVRTVQWSLSALFPFTQREGRIEMRTEALESGTVDYVLSWTN